MAPLFVCVMNRAIAFDDERSFTAIEIRDVIADLVLTAKFEAMQLTASQKLPTASSPLRSESFAALGQGLSSLPLRSLRGSAVDVSRLSIHPLPNLLGSESPDAVQAKREDETIFVAETDIESEVLRGHRTTLPGVTDRRG